MVNVGDTVKAINEGAWFVGTYANGSGTGEVVHVENPEGVATHPEVIASNIPTAYLNDGILYKDEGNQTIMWLAPNDFEVIEGGQ